MMDMDQPGLPFDAPYPSAPGYKRPGTSQAAAEAVKPVAKPLRDQVLTLLKIQPLTADQCADWLGVDRLAIRPRLSELVKMNLIEDTGETRPNKSLVKATVWKAV